MKRLLVKLVGKLLGRNLILLFDHNGKEYVSFTLPAVNCRQDFYPECRVHPFTRVGRVRLLPDGTTGGTSFYIKRWRYL